MDVANQSLKKQQKRGQQQIQTIMHHPINKILSIKRMKKINYGKKTSYEVSKWKVS